MTGGFALSHGTQQNVPFVPLPSFLLHHSSAIDVPRHKFKSLCDQILPQGTLPPRPVENKEWGQTFKINASLEGGTCSRATVLRSLKTQFWGAVGPCGGSRRSLQSPRFRESRPRSCSLGRRSAFQPLCILQVVWVRLGEGC
jgi:hypothetical protein